MTTPPRAGQEVAARVAAAIAPALTLDFTMPALRAEEDRSRRALNVAAALADAGLLALGAGEGSEAAGLRAAVEALLVRWEATNKPPWLNAARELRHTLAARAGGDEGSGGETR